jgi:F-type H+-transporting ATPase subunit epsilon
MSGFALHLASATQYERVDGVTSFVGEDASGSFGILPGHARTMSLLTFGLARFRAGDGAWEYLAVPGAVVYFANNELHVATRRYVRGKDYDRILAALHQEFLAEEEALRTMKQSLKRLEDEMLKRLLKINRGRAE